LTLTTINKLAIAPAALAAEPAEDTFQKGVQVFQSGDKASTVKIFMSAAQAGNSKADVQVGWCYEFAALYERGRSVPENWVEAASWYRSA
jgi:TPR repeat protein